MAYVDGHNGVFHRVRHIWENDVVPYEFSSTRARLLGRPSPPRWYSRCAPEIDRGMMWLHYFTDALPDALQIGLLFVMTARPLVYCLLAYDRFEMPYITPWLPVHMFLFMTVLDLWY